MHIYEGLKTTQVIICHLFSCVFAEETPFFILLASFAYRAICKREKGERGSESISVILLEYKIWGSGAWGVGACVEEGRELWTQQRGSPWKTQSPSARGICSYFLLGINQASWGVSELVILTLESVVLVKVTPEVAVVCPRLDSASLHFGWWGLGALGTERKGRWGLLPGPWASPHPWATQEPSTTSLPPKSRVSCPIWISKLFFYPLSGLLLCWQRRVDYALMKTWKILNTANPDYSAVLKAPL